MPNFFVEAVTVADARVYSEAKQVAVPPESRVLNVDVVPSAASYRPGAKAQVKLKLTDFGGKPFVGSTVVAIYDKSVEYISGGTNVPEIKAFFWDWRRHHNPQAETTVDGMSGNLTPRGKPGMQDVGVFGHSSVDEVGNFKDGTTRFNMLRGGMGGFGGGGMAGFGGMGMGGKDALSLKISQTQEVESLHSAMPAAPPGEERPDSSVGFALGDLAGKGAGAMVQPTVRSQFADTALWVGALTTSAEGTAEVGLAMPENLTTWRIKVWGMGHGTKVGQGQADVVTRKDLILRMQAPRFFVEKDEVVLSANVHNYLKTAKQVEVVLEVDKRLAALGAASQTVRVDAGGEARIDWRVRVAEEGEATIRMKALTDEESDAMEQKFPCYVHGMLKMEAVSARWRRNRTAGG